MAGAPEAGLIQTVPRLIGGRTPLARLQQFAGRVYGPVLARGLGAWFGNAGNYWGHNAIIRTEAFAACAGLPTLPGRKPFGGLILSHDFVEAALLRRAGWAVYMADDLGGSYEKAPPNLIELVTRDRRWAQGNLQHLALLGTKGLHPVNRIHMAMGAMAYLASPFWLLFLLAGMSLALYADLVPPNYFPDGWALFPTWPQIDAQRAILLFGLCLFVLYLPKLIGFAAFLTEPASRGQRLRAPLDLVVEVLLSALAAPILMLTQTRAVFQILAGRDSGWNPQERDADRLSWRTLWAFHKRHMFVGLLLAASAGLISWSLLAWMSPALVSTLIAVPLGGFLGAKAAGDRMRRLGLLTIPEERDVPGIARAADRATAELRAAPPAPADLAALLKDAPALARHMAWIDGPTERRAGEDDPVLAAGWLRLADGLGLQGLDARQTYAVLSSSTIMRRLIGKAPSPAAVG
jgi:membrane glycosyltransferase